VLGDVGSEMVSWHRRIVDGPGSGVDRFVREVRSGDRKYVG
jgi:hypothetical protein